MLDLPARMTKANAVDRVPSNGQHKNSATSVHASSQPTSSDTEQAYSHSSGETTRSQDLQHQSLVSDSTAPSFSVEVSGISIRDGQVSGRTNSTSTEKEELQLKRGKRVDPRKRAPGVPMSYASLEQTLRAESMQEGSVNARSVSAIETNPSLSASDGPTARGITSPPKTIVTSTVTNSTKTTKGKSGGLRRGKWTVEEEAFVARVIQDFNSGYLDAPAGTTLRTYLSEKLQCDPMRITKKFTGDACIGKRVFHPAVRTPGNAAAIDKAQMELIALEKRWRRRLELQQRDSAKKAAAAANSMARNQDLRSDSKTDTVEQTASWLDRAKSALKNPSSQKKGPSGPEDIKSQMQEVQRLIYEGPTIQQKSAGLTTPALDQSDDQATTSSSSDTEPADKRLRTAEDAEALVGFIRTVRALSGQGN